MRNKIKRKIILIIALSSFLTVSAQKDHLELTSYKEKYPERSIVSIKDITSVKIDFKGNDSISIISSTEEEFIYLDKNAAKYADKSVSSSSLRELKKVSAKVQVPVSEKKYKTIKVKEFKESSSISNSYFFDDSKQTKFELPSLRQGAKSNVKKTHELKLPQLLPGCYFGHFTNTEYQEFTITAHKDIKLTLNKFNGVDTLTTFTKKSKGDYVIYKWVAKDLIPLEYESSSPTFLSLAPHIYPVIHSYKRNGKETAVLRNIDDLHAWYEELLNRSGAEYNEELAHLVDSLTKDKETEELKVQAIFEWVQKNIKYVAYEDGLGGFIPRPPQKVYQRKFGDCKDVSLLQVKMMEYAGIKASVGWVGTRDKPYTYEELPAPGCDNHMIAAYERAPSDWIFLDATGTYTAYGYPSAFIQEKEVLLHKGTGDYDIVKVKPVPYNKNVVKDSVHLKLANNDLVGNGLATMIGYHLSDLKYRVVGVDSAKVSNYMKAFLEKGSNKFFFELEETDFSRLDSGTAKYNFEIKDYVKKNGDEYYLNLNLDKILAKSKIDKKRVNSIEKEHFSSYENTFVIDLENKYTIDYLPKNRKFEHELFNYTIDYKQEKDQVIYKQRLVLNHLLLEKEDFESWNKMIKSLNRGYKEVIVLKEK